MSIRPSSINRDAGHEGFSHLPRCLRSVARIGNLDSRKAAEYALTRIMRMLRRKAVGFLNGVLFAAAGAVISSSPQSPTGTAVKTEFIFDQAPFAQCHASTIAETRGGLIAAWFGGTSEGQPDVGIWLSKHDGRAWSAPVKVANGVQPDGKRFPCWNPVLHQAGKGDLLLFYKVGPSPSHWWGMMMASPDGGASWSASRRLPDGILGPVKNHPLALADGTLLCGSSTEDGGWRVHFERTSDRGASWEKTAPINDGREAGLIQPALLRLAGSSIAALMRSTKGWIYVSRSDDAGRTWARPLPTDLPNPNSGIDAVTLRDGRHVLVFNPLERGRDRLSAAVSGDGVRWTTALALENEPGQEFSYPAVIQAADGTIHITYTWKRRRIKHVAVDPAALSNPMPVI
jgi:predicted neuraminidase